MDLPVVDMAQTGQNNQSLRQQRGITVRQLQGILGFATPQAIYNWQHGVSLPTVDNLVALASIFAVPVETILMCFSRMNTYTLSRKLRQKNSNGPTVPKQDYHALSRIGKIASNICTDYHDILYIITRFQGNTGVQISPPRPREAL